MVQKTGLEGETEILAKLAVKHGLATKEVVVSALAMTRMQAAEGKKISFDAALVQMGIANEEQLQALHHAKNFLIARREDRKFAENLLRDGRNTRDQLEAAICQQLSLFRKYKRICRLEEILAAQGAPLEPSESAKRADSENETVFRRADNRFDGHSIQPVTEHFGQGSLSTPDCQVISACGRGIELHLSEDGLKAALNLRAHVECVTIEEVRSIFEEHGITYGLVDESEIIEFLGRPVGQERTLTVAQGSLPVAGKDGRVEYFFDTDPLRIGAIKAGGRIDHKDHGTVPQVKEGDLLARLIPAQEGKNGCTIYGKEITSYKPNKCRLYCGSGVVLGEDGLEARAGSAGRPKLGVDGRITVEPEYLVEGDVNLATGHIEFAGSICVRGTVQDGFRVKGGSLSAGEIWRAEIETDGDIVVAGGIIGAKVRAGGNVKAKFIQGSVLEARGDVVIESSIIDSQIITSSSCMVGTGKIFSSSVQARRGIEVLQIGSEQSTACQLKVGTDDQLESELRWLEIEIREKQQRLARTRKGLHKLNKLAERLEIKVGKLIQGQEDALREIRSLNKEAQELISVNNPVHMEQVKFAVQELQNKSQKARKEMAEIENRQCAPVRARVTAVRAKINRISEQLNDISARLESLNNWIRENPSVPVVKVHGTVVAGTCIRAAHCGAKIRNDLEKVIIKECKNSLDGNNVEWRLALQPLRQL